MQKTQTKSTGIDISKLTHDELLQLYTDVGKKLEAPIVALDTTDVSLEFRVRVRTSEGVAFENNGAARINTIFDSATISTAPERLSRFFIDAVWIPVNTRFMKLLNTYNKTGMALPAQSLTNDNPTRTLGISMHPPGED
ncbi:MAG: hypothetical protein RR382_00185 [Tannerellaceae bacterium]